VALGTLNDPQGPQFFGNSILITGITPSGTVDTTFGTNGRIAVFTFDPFGTVLYRDSTMQSDGKLLLAYHFINSKAPSGPALVRYNQDGSRDTTFAAGISLGVQPEILKVAVAEDGKIYGLAKNTTGNVLFRLNPNGGGDPTFGVNGVKPLNVGRYADSQILDMQTAPGGKVVIATRSGTVVRLGSNGDLDRSFGLQGVAKLYFPVPGFQPAEAVVQPDGKVLLVGRVGSPSSTALARFTTRGRLDAGFGNGGTVISDLTPGGDDFAIAGAVSTDGKIIVCGGTTPPLQVESNFLLAKYASDGTLEGSTVTTPLIARRSTAYNVTLQPDGKILTVGHAYPEIGSNGPINFLAVTRHRDIRNSESTIRRVYDFDGDGRTDHSLYREDPAEQSFWNFSVSGDGTDFTFFGVNGDVPVPSDFDDDGKMDVAVFRPSMGAWFYMTDIHAPDFETVFFGQSGDLPVANDYDGDAKADLALFRPSTGTWLIKNIADGSIRTVQFGGSSDKPVTGDFDGDTVADIALWRSSDATFRVLRSSDDQQVTFQIGTSAAVPTPGDFDGDGKTDFGVFDPNTGGWIYRRSLNNQTIEVQWGVPGDIPTVGDYDGDGKSDVATFRPATASWFALLSGSNTQLNKTFGQSGDIPLPGR
jgi:uncharacterized delta-60 repeat protein